MTQETAALLRCCRICPRECGVNRLKEQTGFCGAGAKIKAARAALHFWEEPCLSGESGSGAVFFSGCSLGCVFCQNREISANMSGLELPEGRLEEIFLELQSQSARNINLVTPPHYLPQIAEALERAKIQGLSIPVVWNSSGYEKPESLRRLNGLVDIYLPDFKYLSSRMAGRYSDAADYPRWAWAALEEMALQAGEPVFDESPPDGGFPAMQRGVILRHLLLPGLLEDGKALLRRVFERYGNRIFYSLMSQYTPLNHVPGFPELNRRVSPEEYDDFVDFAAELGIENGFIQEGSSAEESFIPAFDYQGILRTEPGGNL